MNLTPRRAAAAIALAAGLVLSTTGPAMSTAVAAPSQPVTTVVADSSSVERASITSRFKAACERIHRAFPVQTFYHSFEAGLTCGGRKKAFADGSTTIAVALADLHNDGRKVGSSYNHIGDQAVFLSSAGDIPEQPAIYTRARLYINICKPVIISYVNGRFRALAGAFTVPCRR